jgi:cytochrome c-type biogenesis protein CcsB
MKTNVSTTIIATRLVRTFAVLFAIVLTLGTATAAFAQYSAPAGNEHPETQQISEEGKSLTNPFGHPHGDAHSAPTDVKLKAEFAAKLNLDPLRALAVFHNGRTKVLDTLARETVSTITGRDRYLDFLPATTAKDGTEEHPRVRFDPMFTLMDLMIDPGFYLGRPLIGIGYLPLREKILEAEFPNEEATVSRWKRLGRVTPLMLQSHLGSVMDKHQFEDPYRTAAGRVENAFNLWRESPANMMLVAPDSRDAAWTHLSQLPEGHEARVAALALGDAWRASDAAAAQAAIDTLARVLPTINTEKYPTTDRSLELAYNNSKPFEWGFWAYGVAFVLLILAYGTGRRWLVVFGIGMLVLALAIHAGGFAVRCVIAERYAIQNQFESMTGLSLFGVVVGLTLMLATRKWLFGAAAAGMGFLVLVTATQTGIPGEVIEREAAILNTSILLKYHVTIVLVSYALITLGFIFSLFYLATYYTGKMRDGTRRARTQGALAVAMPGGGTFRVESVNLTAVSAPGQIAETQRAGTNSAASADFPGVEPVAIADTTTAGSMTLRDLDTATMIVLQLAFWTLGVGILLGAWWADHSWGRWWAFDPKETWALITWIVYLIVIHVRFASGKNRGFTTAWLSVLGFIVMLWTYFGVNLLLPGLHAYA